MFYQIRLKVATFVYKCTKIPNSAPDWPKKRARFKYCPLIGCRYLRLSPKRDRFNPALLEDASGESTSGPAGREPPRNTSADLFIDQRTILQKLTSTVT